MHYWQMNMCSYWVAINRLAVFLCHFYFYTFLYFSHGGTLQSRKPLSSSEPQLNSLSL